MDDATTTPTHVSTTTCSYSVPILATGGTPLDDTLPFAFASSTCATVSDSSSTTTPVFPDTLAVYDHNLVFLIGVLIFITSIPLALSALNLFAPVSYKKK